MNTLIDDIEANPEAQACMERSRTRLVGRPRDRERRIEAVAGSLFLAVVSILVIAVPFEPPPLGSVALVVLAYALSLRVEFEVGSGYTGPSIVVFVPMLFLIPAPLVPLCAVAGALLNYLVNVALGRRHIARILVVFGQGWHALGAAVVFMLIHPGRPDWGDLPVLLSAFVVYVALDALASLSVDRYAHREPLRSLLPSAAWIYLVDLLLLPIGLTIAVAVQDDVLALGSIVPLFALLAIFGSERRRRIDHALELSRAYRGTALLLGDVVESDDSYTGAHSRDVVGLALEVGRQLALDAFQLRRLEFGALLHDVGKIAVPKDVLHKPGPLDADEWTIMRRHTIEGQRMLESVGGVLAEVGFVVRCSHEQFDGGGYPDGLSGEDIPIEARICSACDAFSAMTSDRSYRAALSVDAATAELRRCAGSQFDPEVVEALLEVLSDTPVRHSVHSG